MKPFGGWHLDRVAVVMRHGVRPPTKAQPLPVGMAPAAWPNWDVGWGELTHHGEQAVALLGSFDRARYAELLGPGCPAVHAVADSDQRTVRTAEVYVATLLPGCSTRVEHKATGETDPLFSPFGATSPSAEQLLAAARTALPGGDPARLDHDLAGDWAMMDRILGCRGARCMAARPTSLTVANGRIRLGGALAAAASLAETLALEYADGQPSNQIGWGRATRADITRLLALHSWEFAITARPRAIARAAAAGLLGQIAEALSSPAGPVFSLYVGHDTNLALIGGALGLHWHMAQFAPDDPPPGGALIFERWVDAAGRYRLVVRFRSQTLDEMRDLLPPVRSGVETVAFAGCGNEIGCDTVQLRAAVAEPN